MKHVESTILIEELQTDGHSPLKFICSDGAVYFVKYLSGKSMDRSEIKCLVFEMVCTRLLQLLGIPTPDLALVTILGDSITPGMVKINKRHIRDGIIGVGSREVEFADLLNNLELVRTGRDFGRLQNPEDLIRIAIFDLWVDNSDRHSGNYNLLNKLVDGKLRFFAIDHACCFGGFNGMNVFNETTAVSPYRKFIESQYFQMAIKHFTRQERLNIAEGFLSLLDGLNVRVVVEEVFKSIPAPWGISPLLKENLIAFLVSKTRLLQLRQISTSILTKKKSRKK